MKLTGIRLLFVAVCLATVSAKPSEFKPRVHGKTVHRAGKEVWAYVEVRPGAHMFWWMYYTYHPEGHLNRPVVVWLQGGPGASSTGYGNFELIGPLDINLNPRNSTWVNSASILFIDQPVGTGYSYVEDNALFTNTTEEIAQDLYTCIKAILEDQAEFKTVPFWIFGESYGGKMGAATAQRIMTGIADNDIEIQFTGFAMGNAWIHPVDLTTAWAPYLYYLGNVDETGYNNINDVAQRCRQACDNGEWERCTTLWYLTEIAVLENSNNIDFYNVLKYSPTSANSRKEATTRHDRKLTIPKHVYDLLLYPTQYDALDDLMNSEIKTKLQIIPEDVIWGEQSGLVFQYQNEAFMKPVVDIVGNMAEMYPEIDNIVYEGQLDLICLNKGTMDWVLKLDEFWRGHGAFLNGTRTAIAESGQTDLYVKTNGNFKYYWVMNAGHMVPKDNPFAALSMFNRILDRVDV